MSVTVTVKEKEKGVSMGKCLTEWFEAKEVQGAKGKRLVVQNLINELKCQSTAKFDSKENID